MFDKEYWPTAGHNENIKEKKKKVMIRRLAASTLPPMTRANIGLKVYPLDYSLKRVLNGGGSLPQHRRKTRPVNFA